MENEILNIIYNEKNRIELQDFLNEFDTKYYSIYKETLILNSIIFALKYNNNFYINYIKDNISSIDDNTFLKQTTILYAIKNILDNSKIINNKIVFDNTSNNKYIKRNKELIDKLKLDSIKIYTINKLYREELLKFLSTRKNQDIAEFLDKFLNTTELDTRFLSYTKVIKDKDLLSFKYYIIRLILSDNYLFIESDFMEQDTISYIDELKEKYNIDMEDLNDEELDDIEYIKESEEIINHIKSCLEDNYYTLPIEDTTRLNMLENFINYNYQSFSKEYEILNIESDEEKKLNLRKINPLYRLDLLD